MAASSADLAGDKRRQFVARAAANEWDAVIMTRTAFQRVSLSPEAVSAYMSAEAAQLRAELEAAKETGHENGKANSGMVKRLEKLVSPRKNASKPSSTPPRIRASASRKPASTTWSWTSCTTTRTWRPRATSPAPPSRAHNGPRTFT
ncbi:hypothetical protein V3C33_19390 [Micrococcaceae bacterium Sec5.7]